MKTTNKNLKSSLLLITSMLVLVAIADVILALAPGSISSFFSGYSALIVASVFVGTYGYIGLPLFSFDGESEIWHIKSHAIFSRFLGKQLHVARRNIIGVEVDRSGIRKKLCICYMKNGKEVTEKFSISLLSKAKTQRLADYLRTVESEIKGVPAGPLFI